MIFDLQTFTNIHTAISLVALGLGVIVVLGLATGRALGGLSAAYLTLSVATSVTGFGFPFTKFLPSHGVGVLSLVMLAIAIVARYRAHLAGIWRPAYAITITVSVYFIAFVTIVQSFLKVPALHELAPTMDATPFKIAQAVTLIVFIVLGIAAVKGVRRLA